MKLKLSTYYRTELTNYIYGVTIINRKNNSNTLEETKHSMTNATS